MVSSKPLPGVKTVLQGKDDKNRPIFSVLLKRTYDIHQSEHLSRAAKDRPFVQNDLYYDDGDPEWATVKYESEFAAFKSQTDVVIIGKAFAPQGKPAQKFEVLVEVGDNRKALCIFGDRQCLYRHTSAPAFTDPVPVVEVPVHYERAYGGKDMKSTPEAPFYYPRNHAGLGVVIKNTKETVDGLRLPNIEDPQDLLTPERVIIGEPERWHAQPLPDGLGWFQRTWYPRCSFVGAMPAYLGVDTILREETLGLVPKGQVGLAWQYKLPMFDLRFNNGASRGMKFPHLVGGETIKLTNLTPAGLLTFKLTEETPSMTLDIGLGENQLQVFLDTVIIRLEEMQVDLIWRGAHLYPGFDWLPEMKKMVSEIS